MPTIRIPIPQKNPPFMHRRGVSAFQAPSNVPSTQGLGAFLTRLLAPPVLPAPSIFDGVRLARGMGGFFAPASFVLPASNVFPQYAQRGLGRLAPRRFPRSGMGDDDGGLTLDWNTPGAAAGNPTVSDLVAQGYSQTDAENLVINRVLGAGAATVANPNAAPTVAALMAAGVPQAQAQNMVTNYNTGSNLPIGWNSTPTSAASASSTNSSATNTGATVASVAGGTSTTTVPLTTQLANWFNGSTTLFGSAWKNSTLAIGGGVGFAALALFGSMSGGKKRKR